MLRILVICCSLTIFLLSTPQTILACHVPVPSNGTADNIPPPDSGPCPAGLQEIEDLFSHLISVLVGVGFIAMLTMLTWAGFKYLTSGGEQKQIQQAHQIVTWAILGIIFMAIAWLILLLISAFTGVEIIKTFDIKTLCGGAAAGFPFCK